jgi:hypothetical protein
MKDYRDKPGRNKDENKKKKKDYRKSVKRRLNGRGVMRRFEMKQIGKGGKLKKNRRKSKKNYNRKRLD